MDNGQFDRLHDAVLRNHAMLIDLLQRVVRLEERYTRMSVLWGTLGGLVPAVGVSIWWLLS